MGGMTGGRQPNGHGGRGTKKGTDGGGRELQERERRGGRESEGGVGPEVGRGKEDQERTEIYSRTNGCKFI